MNTITKTKNPDLVYRLVITNTSGQHCDFTEDFIEILYKRYLKDGFFHIALTPINSGDQHWPAGSICDKGPVKLMVGDKEICEVTNVGIKNEPQNG